MGKVHELVEISRVLTAPLFRRWRCSCGETGVPVADIPGVCTGYERAASAFRYHVSDVDQWPFPSVTYDYEAAGVGSRNRPIEVDAAEVEQIVAFTSRNKAAAKEQK